MGARPMGFNMFLADDLVSACTQRFKRSKIDGPTYRRASASAYASAYACACCRSISA
eukprot:COSAG02_NODE_4161_length_5686_cov_776.408090_3_plen_57_part_00